MDFSQQYFVNAQPYQQFMGISPLTPSHSNSAASDDFNATSPPDVYPEYPTDQQYAGGFDGFPAQFAQNTTQHAFPSPPTPPNNLHLSQHPQHQQQRNANINGNAPAVSAVAPLSQAIKPQLDPAAARLENADNSRQAGSNSDDDDMTPAQSRRKAQNRAAQRAFRERKEKHVKDLEAKLASLEAEAQQRSTENERLKREMQKMSTENEILRATSAMPGGGNSPEPRTTGPMQYSPTDFYSDLLAKHNNKTPSHRIVTSDDGERLLAAGATWDLIINHEAFRRGLVDVGDVSERLKHQARCDGQGPVFAERSILDAIEASVASGSDELL